MKLKLEYHKLIFVLYILGLISFLFLNCQEITSQEIAAAVTFLTIPCIGMMIKKKATYKKDIVIFLAYILIEIIISHNRYGQPWGSTLYYIVNIFSALLYVFFATRIQISGWYYNTFKLFGKILLFVLYIAYFASFLGIKFLDSTMYRYAGGLGLGLRLTCGMMFEAFYIIILMGEAINNQRNRSKSNFERYSLIILGLIYVVIMSQTRMNILGLLGALATMLIFCMKDRNKKAITFTSIFIIVLLLLQIPSVNALLSNKFGGIFNGTDNSMIPRVGAIPHYIKMAEDHKWLGLGIINPNASSNNKYNLQFIMHGKWLVYSYDDVGIFSFYMFFGLIGVSMYVYMALRLLKRAYIERYNAPYKMGLVTYVTVTGFSMIITDLWRQSNIALFLLLMDLQIEELPKN